MCVHVVNWIIHVFPIVKVRINFCAGEGKRQLCINDCNIVNVNATEGYFIKIPHNSILCLSWLPSQPKLVQELAIDYFI